MTGRVVTLLAVLIVLVTLIGCSTTAQLTTVTVTPSTAIIPNVGGTAQFTATGTYENGKTGRQYQKALGPGQVIWSSSVASVATIDSNGLATATGAGTTTISAAGGGGNPIGTATLTVSSTETGSLTSLTVLPVNQTVTSAGQTVQYIAIGTFTGTQPTQDVTNQVTWSASNANVATISATGLATTVGTCAQGQATTITAALSTFTGTATLTYGSCGQNISPILTVYGPGQGTGTVTSTPTGIDCNTSSGTGCSANFTLNSQVSLTATPASGSVFVGWSANCQPAQNSTCTVTMGNYETVGAIFDIAP
jgi:Divergent InlB B-repeat domain/Bacterial Ig-like domain (group 2)